MQSAPASGTCPDILNSHSRLLMKDALHLHLNRFAPRNRAVTWSHGCAGGPGPSLTRVWYLQGTSPRSSFVLLLCLYLVPWGGTEAWFVFVLQRAFVFRLAPSTLVSPGKPVYVMQNQPENCLDSAVPAE